MTPSRPLHDSLTTLLGLTYLVLSAYNFAIRSPGAAFVCLGDIPSPVVPTALVPTLVKPP